MIDESKKYFYITSTLPYVNSSPHIGTAMEMIRADVIARFKRYSGYEVFFNTGTDEHGQKIYEGAIAESITPEEYVNRNAAKFKEFHKMANISYDAFIRTTDDKHILAAQKMWSICFEKGDIYKAKQKINYCIGCEMEKTDSELVEGRCPDHPNRELVVTEEENYFFKFSKYQDRLIDLYNKGLVKPDFRNNEIRNFVSGGLHDFSVSRLKSKMPWGVEVPGDSDHVMYVWFDALTSYIGALDWGLIKKGLEESAENNFQKFWLGGEVVQYCGKDNNKAQSAIWQAMLLSAGIKNTDVININGHIISGGVKMSKSIGNIISPFDIVEKYSTVTDYPEEVLRFMMCHEVSTYEDSDITDATIQSAYTAYLQNGIGNQVSRILKLSSQYISESEVSNLINDIEKTEIEEEFKNLLNEFRINEAIHLVTDKVKMLDEYIQKEAPFKLVKNNPLLSNEENNYNLENGKKIILKSMFDLLVMSHHLWFFMPRTAEKIYYAVKSNKVLEKGLFGRLD